MKKRLYLPLAAVVGAASLAVWAQANAGPPSADTAGIVVADVSTGSAAFPAGPAPVPSPTASITAFPERNTAETLRVQAELQTYAPVQVTHSPTHIPSDDKGGLRQEGASDDGPSHDLGDDKGGLRPAGTSDDGPSHDVGDDKGGLRAESNSDDGPSHDLDDDKGGNR